MGRPCASTAGHPTPPIGCPSQGPGAGPADPTTDAGQACAGPEGPETGRAPSPPRAPPQPEPIPFHSIYPCSKQCLSFQSRRLLTAYRGHRRLGWGRSAAVRSPGPPPGAAADSQRTAQPGLRLTLRASAVQGQLAPASVTLAPALNLRPDLPRRGAEGRLSGPCPRGRRHPAP